MALADEIQFPCKRMPEDARQARLLGIYPQRGEGLFLQRIRVPGGRSVRTSGKRWRVWPSGTRQDIRCT